VKHRGCTADGSETYKGHKVEELENNIQRGIAAAIAAASDQCSASLQVTKADCEASADFIATIPATDTCRAFTSKSHAPRAFAHVRALFGISNQAFVQSICEQPLRALATPGKSGALFYLTADGRFILKTVSKGESKFLRSMLFEYIEHLKKMAHTHELRTLLPHFYDLIHIDTPGGRNIRLVVMNNLKPVGVDIHEKYDLKGSWVGRWTSDEKKAKAGVTLKDEDCKHAMRVSAADHALIAELLRRDTEFLEAHGVLDYSLLCLLHYPQSDGIDSAHGSAPASPETDPEIVPSQALGKARPLADTHPIHEHMIHEHTGVARTDEGESGESGESGRSDDGESAHGESAHGELNGRHKTFSALRKDSALQKMYAGRFSASGSACSLPIAQRLKSLSSASWRTASSTASRTVSSATSASSATYRSSSSSVTPRAESRGTRTRSLLDDARPLGGLDRVIRTTTDGRDAYLFCGIIDVLQSWRLYKKTEYALRSLRYGTQRHGVSVCEPYTYAERFRTKLVARFVHEEPCGDEASARQHGDEVSAPRSSLECLAAAEAAKRAALAPSTSSSSVVTEVSVTARL